MSVFGRNAVSDRDLLKTISQRIARTGTGSSSKVNVMVQGGTVTLSGSLQYAIQRNPIFRAVENIPGVRRVVDQLIVVDRKKARPDADSTRFYEASQQVADAEPAEAQADEPTAETASAAESMPDTGESTDTTLRSE
jgi:hypothetical protein